MTFGLSLKNSNGEAVISSETYNVIYRGRATHFHTFNGATASGSWNAHVAGGFTAPWVVEYGFTFDAPDSSPIIPFFNCSGYCSISFFKRSATIANRWEIYFFAEAVPNVYCFSKLSSGVEVSGYGISVWDSEGKLTYLSTQPHLIPRSVIGALAPASNYFTYNYGNLAHKEPNQTVLTTPTNHTGTLSVPLLHFSGGNSSTAGSPASYGQYFFTRLAKFDGANVSVRWGTSAIQYRYSNYLYHNEPEAYLTTILADGVAFT